MPDGDVLVHAGDFSERGSFDELVEFDCFLGAFPHSNKIVIAGNHDWSLESDERPDPPFENAIYLQDSKVVIDGVKFYGSPW